MSDKVSSLAEENLVPTPFRRFIPVIGAIIVGFALFGYVAGIRELPAIETTRHEEPTQSGDVLTAVSYREMKTTRLTSDPLAGQTIADLRFQRPELFAPVPKTEEMKLAALADRARNRAYDGAPPTVPHPIDQLSSVACLACHGEGIKVGDRIASRMSHAQLSNCTQCHVSQQADVMVDDAVPTVATFVGVYRSGAGTRASPGAPPSIPHHTWMRENCATCHGTLTRAGTRSTHPWLSNCQQCHAANASNDPSMAMGK